MKRAPIITHYKKIISELNFTIFRTLYKVVQYPRWVRSPLFLLAHAFMGCDKTSKPYGFGKGKGFKLISSNDAFTNFSAVFLNPESPRKSIEKLGKRRWCSFFEEIRWKFNSIFSFIKYSSVRFQQL